MLQVAAGGGGGGGGGWGRLPQLTSDLGMAALWRRSPTQDAVEADLRGSNSPDTMDVYLPDTYCLPTGKLCTRQDEAAIPKVSQI